MKRLPVVLGLLMALVMAVPANATAGHARHLVYGPKTDPLGVSYDAWTRRFGRYLFEPPVAESPIVNPNCDAVQRRGGALFMPVATSEGIVVRCKFPAHKPLLVTPAGAFATLGLDSNTRRGTKRVADQQLRAIHDVVAKVDGQRIPGVRCFKTATWVRLHLGADNLFGVPAGTYHMYLEGYFLMVRGLDPGRHTIWLGDVFTDQTHTDQVATIKFILQVS